MRQSQKTHFTVLLSLCFVWGFSQDEHTIAHTNYAPTKTFYLNPTNTLDNKVWLDIHVIGVGVFVYNDLVYFPKEEFGLIKSLTGGGGSSNIQFDASDSKKSGYLDLDVQLLSGSFQYKEHGFALGIKARGMLDFRRVSSDIVQLFTEGSGPITTASEAVVLEANKMFINQLLFAELALSYSNMFYHFGHKSMALGVTAKYLMGTAGIGIKIDQAEINMQGNPETDFTAVSGSAAYAFPDGGIFTGKGVAVDLGFVYKKTLNNVTFYEPFSNFSSCEPYDYKYKLSASLIDLGLIYFNQGATKYEFDTNLNPDVLTNNFNFNGAEDFPNLFTGSISETKKFTMYTPVALNLMADYNFENNFYASGQFMSGLFRQNSFGVKRPMVLAVSGRYQRKWFEASTSISGYDFKYLRLGLGLRFGYFTIGSDKLLSYFGVRDFYGTDLYFNLRFFMGKKPGCGKSSNRKSRKNRKNQKNRNKTDCVKN